MLITAPLALAVRRLYPAKVLDYCTGLLCSCSSSLSSSVVKTFILEHYDTGTSVVARRSVLLFKEEHAAPLSSNAGPRISSLRQEYRGNSIILNIWSSRMSGVRTAGFVIAVSSFWSLPSAATTVLKGLLNLL
jgi:hypothetical protein